MTNPTWTDTTRDEIYTQLCEAVTHCAAIEHPPTAETATELYLSRLCLLLLEEIADPVAARRALANARLSG